MRAIEFAAHLREKPFKPFRVFTSDGASYDVRQPEMALVSPRQIIIGLDPNREHIVRRFAWCDPLHVVRIERLEDRPPPQPSAQP